MKLKAIVSAFLVCAAAPFAHAAVTITSPADYATVATLPATLKTYNTADATYQWATYSTNASDSVKQQRTAWMNAYAASPTAITLKWSGSSGSSTVTVRRVCDDKTVLSNTTSATSIDFKDPEIGRNYVWTVKNGTTTVTGHFFTERVAPRIINATLGGIRNARDLGGWSAADGKVVKQGMVFRTREWDWVSNGYLDSYPKPYWRDTVGIKLDIDLRKRDTVNKNYHPTNDTAWALNKSPIDYSIPRYHVENDGADSFGGYGSLNNKNGDRKCIYYYFQKFIKSANYPIIFHCSHGKDRTGSLALVLSGLLGVSRQDMNLDWIYSWGENAAYTLETTEKWSLDYAYNAINNNYTGSTFADKCAAYITQCYKDMGKESQAAADIATFRALMLEDPETAAVKPGDPEIVDEHDEVTYREYWWFREKDGGTWGSTYFYTDATHKTLCKTAYGSSLQSPNAYDALAVLKPDDVVGYQCAYAACGDVKIGKLITNGSKGLSCRIGNSPTFIMTNHTVATRTLWRHEAGVFTGDNMDFTLSGSGTGSIDIYANATIVGHDLLANTPKTVYVRFPAGKSDGATLVCDDNGTGSRDNTMKFGWFEGGQAGHTQRFVVTNSFMRFSHSSKTSKVAGALDFAFALGTNNLTTAATAPFGVTKTLVINAGSTLTVDAGGKSAGTYPLITAGTLTDNANLAASATVTGLKAGTTGSVAQSGNNINLVIANASGKTVVTVPTISASSAVYTGAVQKPTFSPSSSNYTVNYGSGDYKSVGNYTITLSLANTTSYVWSDNTSAAKSYSYSITSGGEEPPPTPSSAFDAAHTIVCYGDSLTLGTSADKVTMDGRANYFDGRLAGVAEVPKGYPYWLSGLVSNSYNVIHQSRGGAQTCNITSWSGEQQIKVKKAFTLPATGSVSVSTNLVFSGSPCPWGEWGGWVTLSPKDQSKPREQDVFNRWAGFVTPVYPLYEQYDAEKTDCSVTGRLGNRHVRLSGLHPTNITVTVFGSGSSQVIAADTPFVPDSTTVGPYTNAIRIICAGANDGSDNYTAKVKPLLQTFAAKGGKYLIVSPSVNTGTAKPATSPTTIETDMANTFGDHYLNLRLMMETNGLATATALGVGFSGHWAATNGTGLKAINDSTHFSAEGYKVMAEFVRQKLEALGYLGDTPEPPPVTMTDYYYKKDMTISTYQSTDKWYKNAACSTKWNAYPNSYTAAVHFAPNAGVSQILVLEDNLNAKTGAVTFDGNASLRYGTQTFQNNAATPVAIWTVRSGTADAVCQKLTLTGTGTGYVDIYGGAQGTFTTAMLSDNVSIRFNPSDCANAALRFDGWDGTGTTTYAALTGGSAATTQSLTVSNAVAKATSTTVASGVAGKLAIDLFLGDKNTTATDAPLTFAGAFTVNAGSTLAVNANGKSAGTYPLIAAGALTDGANLATEATVTGLASGTVASVVKSGNAINLVVTGDTPQPVPDPEPSTKFDSAHTIICYGDSLTQGACGTNVIYDARPNFHDGRLAGIKTETSYPWELSGLLPQTYNVIRQSRSGAPAHQIMAWSGDLKIVVDRPFTLPAVGTVDISTNLVFDADECPWGKWGKWPYWAQHSPSEPQSEREEAWYHWLGCVTPTHPLYEPLDETQQTCSFTGWLAGRHVSVRGVWPTNATVTVFGTGTEQVVPAGAEFVPDMVRMPLYSNAVHVVCGSGNDGYTNVASFVERAGRYFDAFARNHKKHIIVSQSCATDDATKGETQLQNTPTLLEQYFAEKYGAHHLNLRMAFVTNGMATAKALGVVPQSSTATWDTALMDEDKTHLTSAGYVVFAEFVRRKLVELGYVEGGTPTPPGPTPEPGPITTNAMANASWGYYLTGLGAASNEVAQVFTNTTETMTWTAPDDVSSVWYLVVGGGGSGGSSYADSNSGGGGGGAGGMVEAQSVPLTSRAFTVKVGKGGAAVAATGNTSASQRPAGNSGDASTLTVNGEAVVAHGGGGGGGCGSRNGKQGGSGGGAYANNTVGACYDGEGNVGGQGTSSTCGGGGGGGAGGVGGTTSSAAGGAGGIGKTSEIGGGCVSLVKYEGQDIYAAGGGGGSGSTKNGAAGGVGGGGKGNVYSGTAATVSDSGANYGCGGGGTQGNKYYVHTSGAGYQGVVIIRYVTGATPKPQPVDPTKYGDPDTQQTTYTWKGFSGPWEYTTNWTASADATYGIPNGTVAGARFPASTTAPFTCTVSTSHSISNAVVESPNATLVLDNAKLTASSSDHTAFSFANVATGDATLEISGADGGVKSTYYGGQIYLGYQQANGAAGECTVRLTVPASGWDTAAKAPLCVAGDDASVRFGSNAKLAVDATALGVPGAGESNIVYLASCTDWIRCAGPQESRVDNFVDLVARSQVTYADGATGTLVLGTEQAGYVALVVTAGAAPEPVGPQPVYDPTAKTWTFEQGVTYGYATNAVYAATKAVFEEDASLVITNGATVIVTNISLGASGNVFDVRDGGALQLTTKTAAQVAGKTWTFNLDGGSVGLYNTFDWNATDTIYLNLTNGAYFGGTASNMSGMLSDMETAVWKVSLVDSTVKFNTYTLNAAGSSMKIDNSLVKGNGYFTIGENAATLELAGAAPCVQAANSLLTFQKNLTLTVKPEKSWSATEGIFRPHPSVTTYKTKVTVASGVQFNVDVTKLAGLSAAQTFCLISYPKSTDAKSSISLPADAKVTVTGEGKDNFTVKFTKSDDNRCLYLTVTPKTPAYPSWIDSKDTTNQQKYSAWVAKFGVDNPTAPTTQEAYLLNCSNTVAAVDAAKAAFKITSIAVDAAGNVTVVAPDQSLYNGTVSVRGAATVDGEYDKPQGDKDARFYKAFLTYTPGN